MLMLLLLLQMVMLVASDAAGAAADRSLKIDQFLNAGALAFLGLQVKRGSLNRVKWGRGCGHLS